MSLSNGSAIFVYDWIGILASPAIKLFHHDHTIFVVGLIVVVFLSKKGRKKHHEGFRFQNKNKRSRI